VEGHDVVRITSEEVVMQNPTPHTSPPRTSLCSASVKNDCCRKADAERWMWMSMGGW
jgi:hypothetical protein